MLLIIGPAQLGTGFIAVHHLACGYRCSGCIHILSSNTGLLLKCLPIRPQEEGPGTGVLLMTSRCISANPTIHTLSGIFFPTCLGSRPNVKHGLCRRRLRKLVGNPEDSGGLERETPHTPLHPTPPHQLWLSCLGCPAHAFGTHLLTSRCLWWGEAEPGSPGGTGQLWEAEGSRVGARGLAGGWGECGS